MTVAPQAPVLAAFALLALAVAYGRLLHLERHGRPATVVGIVAGLLLVEVLLYGTQNAIPAGLFHPAVGPLTFRVFDVVLPLALLARLHARFAPPLRLPSGATLLWAAFFAWYVACGVVGLIRGHSPGLVLIELKAVLYVGGTMALAAGVPVGRYVDGRLERALRPTAVAAMLLLLATGRTFAVFLPGLPVPQLGAGSPDGASVLLTLALLVLALGRVTPGPPSQTALVLPLLLVAVAAGQRASLLSAGIGLAALAVGLLRDRRHVRSRATPSQVTLVTLAVLVMAFTPAFVRFAGSGDPVRVPYAAQVARTFTRPAKALSGTVRINQQRAVRPLIAEHPWLGRGLGTTYQHYDPGLLLHAETNLTHNIATDIWLRAGLAGLGLFLAALGASVLEGVRAWRRHASPRVAALALGALAALAALVAKGSVEPLFDKYRLAVLFGLLLGMLRSAARDTPTGTPAPTTTKEAVAA